MLIPLRVLRVSRDALMEAMSDNVARLREAWDGAEEGGFESLCAFLDHETAGWQSAVSRLGNLSGGQRVLVVMGERCFKPEEMKNPGSSEQLLATANIIQTIRRRGGEPVLLLTGGMDLRVERFHEQTAMTMHGKLCEVMGPDAPKHSQLIIDPALHTGDQAHAITNTLLRYARQRKPFDVVVTVEPRGHIGRFDATWAWLYDELNHEGFDRPLLVPAAYGEWDEETRFRLRQKDEGFLPKTANVDPGAAAHHSANGVVRDRAHGLAEGAVPGGMCDEYGPSRLLPEAYEKPGYGTDKAYASYAHTPAFMLEHWLSRP